MRERDIYQWRLGYDDIDIEILSGFNKIIDGLYDIANYEGNIDDIGNHINLCTTFRDEAKEYYPDINELIDKFEMVRVLIFGSKIDYVGLENYLRRNVDKRGFTTEDAKKMMTEKVKENE